MSIEIRDASEAGELERWNRHVERSPHETPFHRFETLDVLADHSGSTLRPLVGYKGQEPVGVFPVFEMRKGGVGAVFSPPPRLLVTYLGPALLNFQKLSQRKTERRHEQFVEQCLDWLDETVGPRYTHLRTSPGYEDLRPYSWNEFSVTPFYTYRIDLTRGVDDLLTAFSRDARSNVQGADPERYRIEEGGEVAVKRIIDRVQNRYAEQDEPYPLTKRFVVDLYRRLPGGYVRPYECYVDGSFVGGTVALEASDTIYRWQSATVRDVDLPVNDLLDWHLMEAGRDRGRDQYDMVGANTRRLNDYKAKFAPELVPYFSVEGGSSVMTALTSLYRRGLTPW